MILELTRIILRYIGAALITKGVIAPDLGASLFSDPALVQIVAGAVASLVAEIGFAISKLK